MNFEEKYGFAPSSESETHGWECTIPEGFEAEIRDGKVIVRKKESEDERIRKFLVKHVSEWIGCIEHDLKISSKDVESEEELAMFKACLAYLERQKEQKPISSCDIVPYIDDKIAALQDMWREEKVAFDWDDMHEMIEDVARHFYQKEQKPTEWSEEDERILTGIIERGSSQVPFGEPALRGEQMEWLMNRLKSLRPQPHWKPSKEQMKALLEASDLLVSDLNSLYNDLKKLM